MADYEPLRREGLGRQKKACICVAVSILFTLAIAGVVLAMFLWKPHAAKAGFKSNSTNYTEGIRNEVALEVDNNTISFDVTVKLNLASESKQKRSVDCGRAKAELTSICGDSLSDLQECNQDKLGDFLEKYVNDNLYDALAANQEAHFSGITSTEVDIDIFYVKASSIDFKAKITIAYNRLAPSISGQNDSESEIRLQTIVDELKKSLQKCPSFLTTSNIKLGSDSFRAQESFKLTESFVGSWKLVSSEKMDELLQHFGVNFILRKLASTQKPTQNINYNDEDNKWTITTTTTLRTQKTTFEVGKEFEETFQDGRKAKSIVAVEKNKFIQTQRDLEGELMCIITRELVNEDEFWVIIDANVVVAKRVFQRVK